MPPPKVVSAADGLRRITGQIVSVESDKPNHWRLSITTDNVQFVANFKIAVATNRTRPEPSTLIVNGKPRSVCCFDHLAQYFDGSIGEDAPVELKPMPPEADVTAAPTMVRQTYQMLCRRLAKYDNATIALGSSTPDHWTIGLDFPWGGLRMSLRLRHRRLVFDPRYPNQVIVDGVDYSSETDGDIGKALKILLSGGDSTPSSPSTIGRSTGVKGTAKSVEVRTSTVIRT